MSNPSAIQIPLQFDGHNYREWAFWAQTVLGGYGLASHLTGTYETWILRKAHVPVSDTVSDTDTSRIHPDTYPTRIRRKYDF